MHSKDIKAGILILRIIPKLASKIAITIIAIMLKINKGTASFIRFLNEIIVP